MITTNIQLAEAAIDVAKNYKTIYIMNCFGAPMTEKNKIRYCNNHSYNKRPERTAMIQAANENVFGFDGVNLIKGLLWGWNGNSNAAYGGALYKSNNVPDIDSNYLIEICSNISMDFNNIEVGEICWIEGHTGIYVGNGLVVESTSNWANGVQFTACNQDKEDYPRRDWIKHGKLPYVDYISEKEKTFEEPQHSIILTQHENAPKGEYWVKISANLLNVRKGPGKNYHVTTQIKKNTVHKIIKEENNWGYIKDQGWILLDHIIKI